MVESSSETKTKTEEFAQYPELKESYFKVLPMINASIDRFCANLEDPVLLEGLSTVGHYDKSTFAGSISQHSRYVLVTMGGKRGRPFAVHPASGVVLGDKQPYRHFTDLSIIVEVAHKGTVVIDDIEDGTLVRNGVATLHAKLGEEYGDIEQGKTEAINVGNFLYFTAPFFYANYPGVFLSNGIRAPIGRVKKGQIARVVNDELGRAHVGQGADIHWSIRNVLQDSCNLPTAEQYCQMARDKSTYPLAMGLGAILAGATEKQQDVLRGFGEYAGVAFQIKDDLLDLNPNNPNYGEDIRERKVTLPVILTLGQGGKNAARLRKVFSHDYGRVLKEWRWKRARDDVVAVMTESGAIRDAENRAYEFADKAVDLLKKGFPEETKSHLVLEQLIRWGVSRTY